MTELMFTSIGRFPGVSRTESYLFHDSKGEIRHVHQHIVLEGARPRPVEAMLEEVRAFAHSRGNDVSKLKLLHVRHALKPGMQYRVDVGNGTLVERKLPSQPTLPLAAGRVRKTAAKKARKKR